MHRHFFSNSLIPTNGWIVFISFVAYKRKFVNEKKMKFDNLFAMKNLIADKVLGNWSIKIKFVYR